MTTFSPELVKLIQAERKRQGRREAYGKFAKAVFTSTVINLLCALWFMLAVGIAHREWLPTLPTIGYWWALLLVFLLKGVFSAIPASKEGDS